MKIHLWKSSSCCAADEHETGCYPRSSFKPNLRLLCRIDEKGNLLPKEQERIRKVKQTLGIK